MAEFSLKNMVFRSGRMELRKQFHVQRRIGIVYPAFAAAKAIIEGDAITGPPVAINYITNAMLRLNDADWDFVIDACLDLVHVQQGQLWVPLKTQGTNTLQFNDLGLDDLNLIIFNVLYEHFAPFIAALPSLVSAITGKTSA
jgi:hypothetical protein